MAVMGMIQDWFQGHVVVVAIGSAIVASFAFALSRFSRPGARLALVAAAGVGLAFLLPWYVEDPGDAPDYRNALHAAARLRSGNGLWDRIAGWGVATSFACALVAVWLVVRPGGHSHAARSGAFAAASLCLGAAVLTLVRLSIFLDRIAQGTTDPSGHVIRMNDPPQIAWAGPWLAISASGLLLVAVFRRFVAGPSPDRGGFREQSSSAEISEPASQRTT
jgi:hypothetical protein